MSHVFLVGFMGAGKSTVADIVARRLGRPCVDLDDRIAASAGMSVGAIFAEKGEDAFRELESAQLALLEAEPPSIVACGGGIVLRDSNRALLGRMGFVIYLRVSAGETLARIGNDQTRPLLSGPGGVLAATRLLEARESLYAAVADVTIETVGCSKAEVAEQVFAAIGAAAV